MPEFPTYLCGISPDEKGGYRLTVEPASDFDLVRAKALGGRRRWLWWRYRVWQFDTPDENGLAGLLSALRDMGVVFLGAGPGTPAGHVFERLRDQGLVQGRYRRIVWRGPGRWKVDNA